MRYSPLHFSLADSLYFIFYSISPNLGRFGPKPVGHMPRASMQFHAVIPPVQPTHPVPSFRPSFLFTMDVLQPLDPMAFMTTCATLWPMTMLFQLHAYLCWSSSKSPCALCSSATCDLRGFHFLSASGSPPPFYFFFI